MQAQLQGSLATTRNPVLHAAATAFESAPVVPQAAAARDANLRIFQNLHARGTVGVVETLQSPWELFTVVRTNSAGALYANVLKVCLWCVALPIGASQWCAACVSSPACNM